MIIQDVINPNQSKDLRVLLNDIYSQEVTTEEFVASINASKDETIAIIKDQENIYGYFIWSKEQEVDDEENKLLQTIFNVEDLILSERFNEIEKKGAIVELIHKKAKELKCHIIELTVPSQSFSYISIFLDKGNYRLASLRVSKELEKKTEFARIFTEVKKHCSPDLIEILVSKGEDYQVKLIEEPTDYKKVIEEGYNPEIVSLIFDLELKNSDELLDTVSSIAEWEEFSITLTAQV